MPKSMMLLVNPNAGKGGYKSSLAEILEVFCQNDVLPTVYFTRAAGEAPALVRENVANYDFIVCLGGDGTLSEVVNGMMQAENKRPIGYIPLGTANDVAKTLGLSNRPVQAARDIIAGKLFPFDVGQFGSSFFTYVAAFGAFTEVSYGTPQEAKHALGHLAYMLEGMKSIPKLDHYKAIVEYDDGALEGDFIFGAVTNSTSIAGLLKLDSDNVNLSDGMFEVLLIKMPQDIVELTEIINSVLSNKFDGENVLFLKSSEVRILFEKPVAWTRDGEDGGRHRDVMIFNHPSAVNLIV